MGSGRVWTTCSSTPRISTQWLLVMGPNQQYSSLMGAYLCDEARPQVYELRMPTHRPQRPNGMMIISSHPNGPERAGVQLSRIENTFSVVVTLGVVAIKEDGKDRGNGNALDAVGLRKVLTQASGANLGRRTQGLAQASTDDRKVALFS
eukprot:scaffold60957_cov72-Phaeocystis_antarctica.AAC.4